VDIELAMLQDFELNFVQHIKTLLKQHDRKATWSAEPSTGSGRTDESTGPEGRWRVHDYADLFARDKVSLDIFWLKDDSLADSDKLPPPDVIAQEIVDDLEAALEQFRLIAADLTGEPEKI
jgi:type I restriction enzyme M protein